MAPANKLPRRVDAFTNLLPPVAHAPGMPPGQIHFQTLGTGKPLSNKKEAMNFLGGLQGEAGAGWA